MHRPVIREAKVSDLDHVLETERLCFESPFPPAYLEFHLRLGQGIFLIAEVDSEAVGYLLISLRDDDAHLLSIAVLPGFRRLGVGKSLLSQAVDKARAQGVKRIRLEVSVSNEPATVLYRSCGFETVGEIRDYYGPGLSAILMVRDLT